ERARYHAGLARRRYIAVDPANRLVADTLEADWNNCLRAQNQAQEAYDKARQQHLRQLTNARQARIGQLVPDLPVLRHDPVTHAQIADILNTRGMVSGEGHPFHRLMIMRIRHHYQLRNREQRLHDQGLLTLREMADRLGVSTSTIKKWRHTEIVSGQRYNDKGQILYHPPGPHPPTPHHGLPRLTDRRPAQTPATNEST